MINFTKNVRGKLLEDCLLLKLNQVLRQLNCSIIIRQIFLVEWKNVSGFGKNFIKIQKTE